MQRLPKYRLRLFLSVDLVGSTAFKAAEASQFYEGKNLKPKWVAAFTDFYEEFPNQLKTEYMRTAALLSGDEEKFYPRIWKTIGDELILCSRVLNTEHLAHSMNSFVATLKAYSGKVKRKDGKLDVKGNAWVAACPAPNIGFALDPKTSLSPDGLDTTEDIESDIDTSPHKYDFLGKAIDTGFRIAKNSRADRCTISAQLAFLLAEAKRCGQVNFKLGYDGRAELKGVNNGIPYPNIYIDTETDDARTKLSDAENKLAGLTHRDNVDPVELYRFVEAFMDVAKIDKPYIDRRDSVLVTNPKPESYVNFEKAFNKLVEGLEKQDKSVEQAENAIDENGGTLDESSIDDFILSGRVQS